MRRLLALVLTLVLFTAVACSNDDEPNTTDGHDQALRLTRRAVTATSRAPTSTRPSSRASRKEGGSIVFGVESQIATLDPAGSLAQPSDIVTALAIYDPMITYEDGKYAGVLATEWTNSEDLMTWTFTAARGRDLHRRRAVQRRRGRHPLHPPEGPGHRLHLRPRRGPDRDGRRRPSEYEVEFTLTDPNAFFPSLLAGPDRLHRLAEGASQQYGKDYARHPVGTGPFSLESFDSLVLKKNPNYWQKDDEGRQLPYLDEIKIEPIPDAQVRLQSLQSGDVDILQTADTGTVVDAVKDGQVQAPEGDRLVGHHLDLQHAQQPFDDMRLRQASALGFDRERLNSVLYQGSRQEAYGPFAADSPFLSKKYQFPKRGRREAAKKLVARGQGRRRPTKLHDERASPPPKPVRASPSPSRAARRSGSTSRTSSSTRAPT